MESDDYIHNTQNVENSEINTTLGEQTKVSDPSISGKYILDCKPSNLITMAPSNTIHTRRFFSQRFKIKSFYNQDRVLHYYPDQTACKNCLLGYNNNVHKTLFVFIAPHSLFGSLDKLLRNVESSFESARKKTGEKEKKEGIPIELDFKLTNYIVFEIN